MDVKKLILLLLFSFLYLYTPAQSPDDKIGISFRNKDYFQLEEDYGKFKKSLRIPWMKKMSEYLINYHFNQPTQAIKNIDSLVTRYSRDIGPNNVQGLMLVKSTCLKDMGEYGKAADALIKFKRTSNLKMDAQMSSIFDNTIALYGKMRAYPKTELKRSTRDCVIPIEIDTIEDGRTIPYISVVINDKKERFIFDTGCPGGGLVSERFAKRHKIKIVVDSIPIAGVESAYGKVGFIDKMLIGNMIYKNIFVTVAPSNAELDAILKIDAILGSDVMRATGEVQIYPRQQIIVFPLKESPMPNFGRNMMFYEENIYVKAYNGDERLTIHLDTGNSGSDLHFKYFKSHKQEILRTARKDRRMSSGMGGVKMKDVYILPIFKMKIGHTPFDIKNMTVNTAPVFESQGNEDGAIGMQIINMFDKVTINFNKMFFKVEKSDKILYRYF